MHFGENEAPSIPFLHLASQKSFLRPTTFPAQCSRLNGEISSELFGYSNQNPDVCAAKPCASQHTCVSFAQVRCQVSPAARHHITSAPSPSHKKNFQSQFLVDLHWFILVLHFVPHIQLFKSPVLLDFYKNIIFSKAEKRERYILIYKRKKAKSDISLYS